MPTGHRSIRRIGSHQEVQKSCAETDVLPAIAAVLSGARFVSKSVERSARAYAEALPYDKTVWSDQGPFEIAGRVKEEDNHRYEQVAGAAVSLMRSEFASMQRLDLRNGNPGELVLLSFRGFTPEAAKFWQRVFADSGSTCAAALRTGKRVIVPDVETCEFMGGTEDLATYRQTGIRAVQTTPLLTGVGRLVGMISAHWRNVHTPKEDDLRMLDMLATQTADFIERHHSDQV